MILSTNFISSIIKHQPTINKVIILIATAGLIPLMFPRSGQTTQYDYVEGGLWRNSDLVAPYDFTVTQPQEEIDKELENIKSHLVLYYHIDSNAHASAVKRLNDLALSHPEINVRKMRHTLDSIYTIGYLEMPDSLPDFGNHILVLLQGNVGSQHTSKEYVLPLDINNALLRDSILVPSITYDACQTQLELDSRMSQIRISSERIQQGELIIAKGEYITPEKAQAIRSLEQEDTERYYEHYSPLGHYLGQFVLCLIAFMALYMFLKNTRHTLLDDNRKVLFVMLLVLLLSALTAVVVNNSPEWVLIVPICIVPVMVRIFFDMRVALYVHVTIIVILANMVPNPFEFIFYQLIAGMMSIVTVRHFESRAQFFLVSAAIFASYSLIYTFGVLSQESTLEGITLSRYAIFFFNAILTLLSYPLIYLFENLFGLTTNLTLMELSSTNTAALRNLSRNAPGTFQHSMQVANISEDLINEIGGNSLLAKVGALYHDIGKTEAPLYFTENQNSDFNPHDELDYEESATVIIQHVRDGLKLAKQYHLPSAVCDFIRTHHGTTLTGYFYNKQKSEHPDDPIDIAQFRYPGPMPYSRETAVVMIVDSVEAACKSLKEHDKENIDKLVDGIIDGKIRERQLQNCDLTMGDLTRMRQILKEKMLSIYHARIAYPVAK